MGRLVVIALLVALWIGPGCIRKTRLPLDDDTVDDDSTGGTDDDADDDPTLEPGDDTAGDDDADCTQEVIIADPDGEQFGLISLSEDLQPQIDAGCNCHQLGNPAIEDLSPGRTWSSWVEQPSRYQEGEVLVVPQDPRTSVVFWKVFDCYALYPFLGEGMPPNAPPLEIDEVSLYYNWILQGAADN